MEGLTVGRIVRYVMADGQVRPGIIVDVLSDVPGGPQGVCDIQVFIAGKKDAGFPGNGIELVGFSAPNLIYREGVEFDNNRAPGTWHWPEQVKVSMRHPVDNLDIVFNEEEK